jgi:histidine ammonia-lyase
MATFAARKAGDIVANAVYVVAIELLAAAQGIDFHAPLKTSPVLQEMHAKVRTVSERLTQDRSLAGDIERVRGLIAAGAFR